MMERRNQDGTCGTARKGHDLPSLCDDGDPSVEQCGGRSGCAVNLEGAWAKVTFDPTKASRADLARAVQTAGYQVE